MDIEGVIMKVGVETHDGRIVHNITWPDTIPILSLRTGRPYYSPFFMGMIDEIWQEGDEVRCMGSVDDHYGSMIPATPGVQVVHDSSIEDLPAGAFATGELRAVMLGRDRPSWDGLWIEPLAKSGSRFKHCGRGICAIGERHEGECVV